MNTHLQTMRHPRFVAVQLDPKTWVRKPPVCLRCGGSGEIRYVGGRAVECRHEPLEAHLVRKAEAGMLAAGAIK